MKLYGRLFALFVLLAAFVAVGYCADEKEKEKAAEDASVPWLALVDSNQYGESWFQTSSSFRDTTSKEQWIDALKTVRAPLGAVDSRKLKSASYTTKMPNAPTGEYVVLQNDTDYKNKPGMVETVIMALDKKGQWKVTGYFIKPAGR